MALNCLFRLGTRIPIISQRIQPISTTSALAVKEIKVQQNGKILEISAQLKASPRTEQLMKEVKSTESRFCPKCTLGLEVKHTDVLILKQYLREDGTMLPRRITKLCATQQRYISTLVLMARRAGLLPTKAELSATKNPDKCFGYRKLNNYYDENTIKYARLYVTPERTPKRPVVVKRI